MLNDGMSHTRITKLSHSLDTARNSCHSKTQERRASAVERDSPRPRGSLINATDSSFPRPLENVRIIVKLPLKDPHTYIHV